MDHHRNALFTNDWGKKAIKPYPDITQCVSFPSTNLLNLDLICSIFLCNRYDIPIILQKHNKGGQYGIISRTEGNKPDGYHLTSFADEDYSEKQKYWMYNIRNTN